MTNLDSVLKRRDITLLTKVHIVKALVFPRSHIAVRDGSQRRQSTKDWSLWTVVLEKTPESPLDRKKIKPVNPKWNNLTLNTHWKDWCWSWSSSVLVIWCRWLIVKDADAGKDPGQKEKRASEHEMAGHLQCNKHELGDFRRWWGTGRPGVPDWETKQQQHWKCCKV